MSNQLNTQDPMRDRIMNMIKKGGAQMKPRWRFVMMSVLLALGVAGTFLVLLYAASLLVFLLRESGVWFAPSFGGRGWFVFARAVPLVHIMCILLLIVVLEALIHRYAFVYRRPLVGSFLVVAVLIMIGGVLIGQTAFHTQIASYTRGLPPLLNFPYGPSVRIKRPSDIYRGTIVTKESTGFIIAYKNDGDTDSDDGYGMLTSRILITPHTRLPYGEKFNIGTTVVVEGDRVATDTIEAFGVRDVDGW